MRASKDLRSMSDSQLREYLDTDEGRQDACVDSEIVGRLIKTYGTDYLKVLQDMDYRLTDEAR